MMNLLTLLLRHAFFKDPATRFFFDILRQVARAKVIAKSSYSAAESAVIFKTSYNILSWQLNRGFELLQRVNMTAALYYYKAGIYTNYLTRLQSLSIYVL